jgi:hypothetical protein
MPKSTIDGSPTVQIRTHLAHTEAETSDSFGWETDVAPFVTVLGRDATRRLATARQRSGSVTEARGALRRARSSGATTEPAPPSFG